MASADEQDVIELTVEKVWDDNEGSSRPDSIEMEIFQNSGFYDAITLTKEDGWVKTIMVPRTDENGNEYDYEVEETVPDGYESTVRKTVVRDGQTDPEGPENPPAPASYTVTWYDEDGVTVLDGPKTFSAGETEPVTSIVPEKAADHDNTYRFSGWSKSVDNDGNIKYVATYEAVPVRTYMVTYKDGANGSVFSDKVFDNLKTGDQTPSFGSAPSREGYTFTGWDPVPGNTVGTSDAVYTAVWTKNPEKTITVTWKNMDMVIKTVTVSPGSDYTAETPDTPSREGYRFAGWGQGVTDPDGNITFEAVWDKIPTYTYTVSYDGIYGGAVSSVPATQTQESENTNCNITLSDMIPVYEGYVFKGWAESANADTGSYAAGSTVALTYPDHASITLYAVWEAVYGNSYDVEFDANGGMGAPEAMRGLAYGSSHKYLIPGLSVTVMILKGGPILPMPGRRNSILPGT